MNAESKAIEACRYAATMREPLLNCCGLTGGPRLMRLVDDALAEIDADTPTEIVTQAECERVAADAVADAARKQIGIQIPGLQGLIIDGPGGEA